MSFFRPLLLAVLLTGCGFTPVYGPGGEALALRGAVLPAEPETDIDFTFVRQIEERLGLPNQPRLTLNYSIFTGKAGLGIDGSNSVTRFNVSGTLVWSVVPIEGGRATLRGREVAFTSYSAGESPLAALESERDALRRLAVLLADRAVARLLASAP